MRTLERGFDAFQVGDNPYDLGNGAVRQLADITGVRLGELSNPDEIQAGFAAWGKDKEFRSNIDVLQTTVLDGANLTDRVADIIEGSGILHAVNPRNIDGETADEFDHLLIGGGVTNWIYRRVRHADELVQRGYQFGGAVLLGTQRVMGSPTEANTYFVRQWKHTHEGALPTEIDYLRGEVSTRLGHIGIDAEVIGVEKAGFAEMVKMAAEADLLDGTVFVAQNAPAGSTFTDVRAVVDDERLYFGSDGVAIARTDAQMNPKNALRYQNPFSAASALIRWVKAVHDINASR